MTARELGELSESERELSDVLEMELYEAQKMREWFAAEIQSRLTKHDPISWEHIKQFAEWTGRLVLIKDRKERMGL